MNVGKSSRTPYKHWLLNTMAGKVAGVLKLNNPTVPAKLPLLLIDMCAGDGEVDEINNSSPAILIKHAAHNEGSKVILFEKNSLTYSRLEHNYPEADCRNESSESLVLSNELVSSNQAVFINCDPNSVASNPINPHFTAMLTPATTFIVTLGCNAGGVQRIVANEGELWHAKAIGLICNIPSFHDVHLYILNNDSHMWAYMARLPLAWSDDYLTTCERVGNKMWKNGVTAISYKCEPDRFKFELNRLFNSGKWVKK
jgi:hypothetical protein